MMSELEQQQQQQQRMRDFQRSSKRFQSFARRRSRSLPSTRLSSSVCVGGSVALNRSVSALCGSFNELSALHENLDQFNSVFSSLLEGVDLQSSTLRFVPLPSAAFVGDSSHALAAKLKPKPKLKAVSPPLNVQLPMQPRPQPQHKKTGRIPSPKVRASAMPKAEATAAPVAAAPTNANSNKKKKNRVRPALKKLPAMYKSEVQRERLHKVLDALADHAEGLCLSEVVRLCGFSGIKTSEYLSLLTKLKHVERRKEKKKGLTYTLSSAN